SAWFEMAAQAAWREIFNDALIAYTYETYTKGAVDAEGRAVFYHLRGRTINDKKFTTGGIENNKCTEKLGIAGVTQPAVQASDKVEKRWLKDPPIVVAHEFGHLFLLNHSAPRLFDSKVASGVFESHLAHDRCIMNYD